MQSCICSSCKNLKSIIQEDSDETETQCEFGYPSEACENCESVECEAICNHYEEDIGEEFIRKVRCSDCGKELEKAFDDGQEDETFYCVVCYLKNL